MFESFKGLMLKLCLGPRFSLASEQVEGGDNVGEVWNEFPVKACEPSE